MRKRLRGVGVTGNGVKQKEKQEKHNKKKNKRRSKKRWRNKI